MNLSSFEYFFVITAGWHYTIALVNVFYSDMNWSRSVCVRYYFVVQNIKFIANHSNTWQFQIRLTIQNPHIKPPSGCCPILYVQYQLWKELYIRIPFNFGSKKQGSLPQCLGKAFGFQVKSLNLPSPSIWLDLHFLLLTYYITYFANKQMVTLLFLLILGWSLYLNIILFQWSFYHLGQRQCLNFILFHFIFNQLLCFFCSK